jgi:hypothetical protein
MTFTTTLKFADLSNFSETGLMASLEAASPGTVTIEAFVIKATVSYKFDASANESQVKQVIANANTVPVSDVELTVKTRRLATATRRLAATEYEAAIKTNDLSKAQLIMISCADVTALTNALAAINPSLPAPSVTSPPAAQVVVMVAVVSPPDAKLENFKPPSQAVLEEKMKEKMPGITVVLTVSAPVFSTSMPTKVPTKAPTVVGSASVATLLASPLHVVTVILFLPFATL